MKPVDFPESNCKLGPPEGMTEDEVVTIPAHIIQTVGGELDGQVFAVVAWKPSVEDVRELMKGGLIYLTMMGGLTPHYLTTKFPFKES